MIKFKLIRKITFFSFVFISLLSFNSEITSNAEENINYGKIDKLGKDLEKNYGKEKIDSNYSFFKPSTVYYFYYEEPNTFFRVLSLLATGKPPESKRKELSIDLEFSSYIKSVQGCKVEFATNYYSKITDNGDKFKNEEFKYISEKLNKYKDDTKKAYKDDRVSIFYKEISKIIDFSKVSEKGIFLSNEYDLYEKHFSFKDERYDYRASYKYKVLNIITEDDVNSLRADDLRYYDCKEFPHGCYGIENGTFDKGVIFPLAISYIDKDDLEKVNEHHRFLSRDCSSYKEDLLKNPKYSEDGKLNDEGYLELARCFRDADKETKEYRKKFDYVFEYRTEPFLNTLSEFSQLCRSK
ncbi:MAG: hypothetical protein U0354_07840 [Candidatus Sericytochromatia bacterium]